MTRTPESSRKLCKAEQRRTFIKRTAAATGWVIVPRHVLGGRGYTPPSERLNIASIGAGGMAASDIKSCSKENIVALCDVDWANAARTFEAFPKAARYRDFKVMLEKEDKNIDAVIVATPDHTHAVAAMAAIRRGKHVYCEKPLCKTIYETRKLMEEARKARVATQMGNQGHSSEGMKLMCEWIWDGAIGPVREVDVWTTHAVWPQGMTGRPAETPPVPDTLDWDLWLGPAPYRPYSPAYAPTLWRGWWDFGTGAIGDMACHNMDPVMTALKLGHPTSIEASCSIYVPSFTWNKPFNKESYPQASIIRYQFPARGEMPPVKLTWYDGGLEPERPVELGDEERMGNNMGGAIFKGDRGKLMCSSHSGSPRLIPQSFMEQYTQPPRTLPRVDGHHQEWIRACKEGTPTGSNFEYAGLLTQVALLGNVALRCLGKKLLWDPENMKITNFPEANDYFHYEYRKGWDL
ncbi:MAG: Gfo/Idh/MocA family oxidoreductase [Acidobacteria bacterium]|nr:Gfo/Idh/MocA family oxidoreductase [Acidobacteriota bacterium]